jgi:hypothetical protein
MDHFDRRVASRLAGVAAGAVVGGLAVGYAVGLAVFGSISDGSNDLSELGNAMGAGVIAFLAAVAVYVTATIVGVRWAVAEGRRAATAGALIVAPVLLALAAALTGAVAKGPLTLLAWVGAIGLMAVVAVAVLHVAGALDDTSAARLAVAFAGGATLCLALPVVFHPSEQKVVVTRADVYRSTAIPVALIDGVTLEAPVAGWQLNRVEHPLNPADIPAGLALANPGGSVVWQTGDRFVQLQMVAQRAPAASACTYAQFGEVCDRLGTIPGGGTVRGMRNPGDPAGSGYTTIWVDVAGGRWILTAGGGSRVLNPAESVRVLSRLQLVDADRYVAVAGP